MKPIKKIFSEALGLPEEQISDELAYNTIPEWDSISHMSLIAAIDSEYGVALDTEDIIGLSSVAKSREILEKYNIVGV